MEVAARLGLLPPLGAYVPRVVCSPQPLKTEISCAQRAQPGKTLEETMSWPRDRGKEALGVPGMFPARPGKS